MLRGKSAFAISRAAVWLHNRDIAMTTQDKIVVRNPKRGLESGVSPRERGRQKLVEMLCWIYKWYVTATPIAREFIGTTETNYLQQLERKGLVKSFNAPSLLCGRGYLLTQDGVNAAATALGKELPYSLHPSNISHSLLKHNLTTQRVCIAAHKAGHDVTPSRFLNAGRDGKIPDALIEIDGVFHALEIELSGKWSDELEQSLLAHLKAVSSGEWHRVAYVSNTQSLLDRYKNRLSFPIPDWWQSVQNDGSRRWIRGEARSVTDDERRCFSWTHAPELLKGFEMR
jgi:hypothetical protein